MKIISLLILINALQSTFCYGQHNDTLIYVNPDIQPYFKYDTCSNLMSAIKKYFIDNYKMPNALTDNGYLGRIVVEFVIEKDSSISNVSLMRGIDVPLDISVLEIIKKMPKWYPGINNGQIVRAKIVVPISIYWLYGNIYQ